MLISCFTTIFFLPPGDFSPIFTNNINCSSLSPLPSLLIHAYFSVCQLAAIFMVLITDLFHKTLIYSRGKGKRPHSLLGGKFAYRTFRNSQLLNYLRVSLDCQDCTVLCYINQFLFVPVTDWLSQTLGACCMNKCVQLFFSLVKFNGLSCP